MLRNPEMVVDKYVCGKIMGKYLIYQEHIDPLGIKDGFYFFAMTEEFKQVIERLPVWFKLLKNI